MVLESIDQHTQETPFATRCKLAIIAAGPPHHPRTTYYPLWFLSPLFGIIVPSWCALTRRVVAVFWAEVIAEYPNPSAAVDRSFGTPPCIEVALGQTRNGSKVPIDSTPLVSTPSSPAIFFLAGHMYFVTVKQQGFRRQIVTKIRRVSLLRACISNKIVVND